MGATRERKSLQLYLDKAYPILVYPDEEGGYVAEIEELPGCITQGETIDEVMQLIEDAKRAWMEVEYEEGADIPLPRSEETYSGKILVRLPKYLHRRLAQQAVREGTSLNQYIVSLLSGGLGNREALAGTANTDEATALYTCQHRLKAVDQTRTPAIREAEKPYPDAPPPAPAPVAAVPKTKKRAR